VSEVCSWTALWGGGGEDSAVLWGRPIVEGAGEGHQEKLVMP